MRLDKVAMVNPVHDTNHRPCLDFALDEIVLAFENFSFPAVAVGAPTSDIRKHFGQSPSISGWVAKQNVNPDVPKALGRTSFEVDFAKIFRQMGCGADHQVLFELAFDNRQAVGSNLLKMEVASRKHAMASGGGISFGILLCPGSNILTERGWDPAVGTSAEYENALLVGYKGILNSNFGLLVVR